MKKSVQWTVDEGMEIPARIESYYDELGRNVTLDDSFLIRVDSLQNISEWPYSNWSSIPYPQLTVILDHIEWDFESFVLSYIGLEWTGTFWFNPFLPNEPKSVFFSLLDTWTEGPWGRQIQVEPVEYSWIYDGQNGWGYRYSFHEDFFVDNITYEVEVLHWEAGAHVDLIKNCTIVGRDSTTNETKCFFRMSCDLTSVQFQDWCLNQELNYTVGQTGNEIIWQFFNGGPYEIYEYSVLQNDSLFAEGRLQFNKQHLTINIDGLTPGSYEFTVFLSDFVGHSANTSAIVTVYEIQLSTGLQSMITISLLGLSITICLYGLKRKRE